MLRKGDGHTWTEKDRMLVQALHLYEVTLCSCGCGQPARVSQDERFDGWFEVHKATCYAKAAFDRDADGDTKPAKGELRYIVNELPWGKKP